MNIIIVALAILFFLIGYFIGYFLIHSKIKCIKDTLHYSPNRSINKLPYDCGMKIQNELVKSKAMRLTKYEDHIDIEVYILKK